MNVDSTVINTFGLCSGVGMLEEAVRLGCEFFGRRTKSACLCEWDAYAAAVLLARMENAALEPCPIWCGDMRELDAKPFRGMVGILTAGLPCPAFSVAGQQGGLDDHRAWGDDGAPIPQFLRIVSECRPALVFIENVPPFVRGGYFRPVGEELSRLGYEIELPLFVTAESVGAAHRRERVFVLAHRGRPFSPFARRDAQQSGQRDAQQSGQRDAQQSGQRDGDSDRRDVMAQPASGGLGIVRQSPAGDGQPNGSDDELGDPGGAAIRRHAGRILGAETEGGGERELDGNLPERFTDASAVVDIAGCDGQSEPRQQRARKTPHEGGGESNLADDVQGWPTPNSRDHKGTDLQSRNGGASLSHATETGEFSHQGQQPTGKASNAHLWPAVEPGFHVSVDGLAVVVGRHPADQLRCVGNGVVATAAAVAFIELMRTAMREAVHHA